ncbi:cohesin subunit SA-3 [Dendropsophus ebraccatus]|uniref:cohesin subunit SA-3 n=1 Tax=Dendropsophus ebraccatus TaxID=150705 RepID=UPI0038317A52
MEMASPVPHTPEASPTPSSSPVSAISFRSPSLRQEVTSGSPTSDGGRGETTSTGEEPGAADMEMESLLESIDDDDESDFEETLRKKLKRTRRPAVKQTQAIKQGRGDVIAGKDLFEALRLGRSAMQALVGDWLDGYKTDRQAALLGLINFIIQACGCKGVVTNEMMETMQNTEIIRKMTEDFNEDSADYPLSLTTRPWKKFRGNFGEFLDTLVSCCQYNILYDGILMDMLISFLVGLSDSQVRAFRHTSTFAVCNTPAISRSPAMKMITALVKVARDLKHHQDTSQRQFNVERAKSPENRSAERLETLVEKMSEMHSNLEDIANKINGLCKGVFVHRYRDVHPEVRALCIKELGTWMTIYPQFFLNDGYMKYLGWMLHDKQGHVRLQCLQCLHELYIVPQWAGSLELFTSRFKNRIVAMVLDREHQVSAEAIQLIGLIHRNMESALSTDDCETVYPLVYSANRAVATAAGEFVYHRLLCTSSEESSPEHGSRRSSHASFFHLLIEFFISSKLHEHAAYLVDSLWDSASRQLKDWECQTDLLLMKKTCLDDQEESALVKILVASTRQAAEGTSPVGRVPVKKILSAKDKKTRAEDRLRLSRHLVVTLPHLLAKFSADEDKVAMLLKVVEYLQLEIYSTERQEKNLDLLLIQAHDIMQKHTEPRILEACSQSLYILCDRNMAFSKRTEIMLSQLVDMLIAQFQDHLPDILQVTDLDEDDVYNMAATIKRLSALYSAHDLTRWELFEPCSHIVQKAIDTSEVPEQILLPVLVCCHFSLLWELFHFSKSQPPKDEDLAALRRRLLSFLGMCQSLLSDLHCNVREQAFKLLSDLLVIFGDHIGHGDRSHLQTLSCSPDLTLQAELAGFLVDHVFTNFEDEDIEDESEKLQQLHERRVLLAGYCKLILFNTLDLRFASEVFKYYVKYYTDYGDIIKEALSRSRRMSKEGSTRAILLCLTQAYTGLILEDVSPDRRFSQPFLEIRDLARRFSLLLGPDQVRNREDVLLLHKEGIKFSLRPPAGAAWSPENVLFLDILSEFSPKLLRQDKASLLQYLEETCQLCIPPEQAVEGDETWAPLHAYKKSLGTDVERSPSTPRTRRTRERRQAHSPWFSPLSKRRRFSKEVSSSDLGEEEEGGQSPLMSSTMLRRRVATPAPADDRGGSDSDFDTSQSFTVRRPLLPARTLQRTQEENPFALRSSLHRLSLREEEEEGELVIDDRESSMTSSAGEQEEPPDLLDSAILDSEE